MDPLTIVTAPDGSAHGFRDAPHRGSARWKRPGGDGAAHRGGSEGRGRSAVAGARPRRSSRSRRARPSTSSAPTAWTSRRSRRSRARRPRGPAARRRRGDGGADPRRRASRRRRTRSTGPVVRQRAAVRRAARRRPDPRRRVHARPVAQRLLGNVPHRADPARAATGAGHHPARQRPTERRERRSDGHHPDAARGIFATKPVDRLVEDTAREGARAAPRRRRARPDRARPRRDHRHRHLRDHRRGDHDLGAVDHPRLHDRRRDLRVLRARVRGAGLLDPGLGQRLHVLLRDARRARGVDHRLGPDPRVRRLDRGRRGRLGPVLQRAARLAVRPLAARVDRQPARRGRHRSTCRPPSSCSPSPRC